MTHFPNLNENNQDVHDARILQDTDGEWGIYIIPGESEICISEQDLRDAIATIEQSK